MELLVVISHPQRTIRSPGSIADDLARVYDAAYSQTSKRQTMGFPHATVILLSWQEPVLGWSSWREDDRGTMATVGLPLLHCPPGEKSAMLSPDRLATFVDEAAGGRSEDLGCCGGYFAAARADRNKQVTLVTNYLAEVPLYRASKDGVTVWSNRAAAAAMLAGIKPKLDRRAAVEFITLSHCLENRTLFEGVETEPPACCVVIDQNGHRSHPYLDLPTFYFAHRLPVAETATQVVGAIRPLIEALRDTDEEVRLHLTGGQDSRAVAAMCRHHGFSPLCLTHNTPNEETASAGRLAKYLGMKYRTVEGVVPTWDLFSTHAQQSLWQSDGLMSLKYLAGLYDLEYTRREGYLPIEGLGGEYGRAYYYGTDAGYAKAQAGKLDYVYGKAMGDRDRWWPDKGDLEQVHQTIESVLTQAQADGLDTFQTTTWYYVNQKMRRWAVARRNVGWRWFIDPLQMPCWTYRGMSADPDDQRGDGLIRAVIDTAWSGTTGVPTVPELAYAARRRRVASNRIVRIAMRWYDRFRRADPEPIQIRVLRAMRGRFVEQIRDVQNTLSDLITADQADRWLDGQPLSYLQTELFWHTLTVAMWNRVLVDQPPAIIPCLTKAR